MDEHDRRGVLYIVEDDAHVRELIEQIAGSIGLRAISFEDPDRFLALEEFEAPAVVVMDLRLPGLSGLEAYARLRARRSELPVVFLSAFGDVPTVASAMKAGAFDFLEKPFRQHELIGVVQAALSQHAATQARTARRVQARGRLSTLTPREREVVPYVLRGLPSKVIAAHLGVAKKTVDLHRSNVMHKAGAGSLAELFRIVLDAADESLLDSPTVPRA